MYTKEELNMEPIDSKDEKKIDSKERKKRAKYGIILVEFAAITLFIAGLLIAFLVMVARVIYFPDMSTTINLLRSIL